MVVGEETQYFLRVELTLLAEQLNDAIDRAFRLRMRAIEKKDLLSVTGGEIGAFASPVSVPPTKAEGA